MNKCLLMVDGYLTGVEILFLEGGALNLHPPRRIVVSLNQPEIPRYRLLLYNCEKETNRQRG